MLRAGASTAALSYIGGLPLCPDIRPEEIHPYAPLSDTVPGYIAVWFISRDTFHEVILISRGGTGGTVEWSR